MIVVIKKGPNRLYGVMETVVGLGITRERAETVFRYLLI
jgi:hypothetical protein